MYFVRRRRTAAVMAKAPHKTNLLSRNCVLALLLASALLLPVWSAAGPPSSPGAPGLRSLLFSDPDDLTGDKPLPPAQRKIGSHLRGLVKHMASMGRTRAEVLAGRPGALSNAFQKITDSGDIQCYVEYFSDPDSVSAAIAQLGGTVELVSREMGLVQCRLPYDQVEVLADSPLVRIIRLPSYAMTRSGSLNSQGDGVHRSDIVRNTRGYTGAGIKVGVISDGINGISTSQASGDIPATYQAQSARFDHNLNAGPEGTAMMEIVYDLAPGAALAFSNPGTSAEMVSAINILDSTFGCKVICDDIGFSDEPFFQDGGIVTRINQAVANGKIYVSAAGNAAYNAYYEGDYSGATGIVPAQASWNVQNFGGNDWNIQASIPAGGYIVAILQWNDQWGASGNNYELYSTDSSGNILASSTTTQNGNDNPEELLQVTNSGSGTTTAYFVVRLKSGSARRLKIVTWGSGTLSEYATATGSVWGHPAADNVVCAGAVRYSTPSTIEYFSSRGPVRIDYPSLAYRNKPDLCGCDGISVTGNGGFVSSFYGTSAAAPHVAAVCAQIWSMSPGLANSAIRGYVQNSAVDLGATGYDTVYGYGRADAVNAANLLCPVPTIGQQPTDRIVCTGGTASFSVAATGSSLAYQWKKGTTSITNGGHYSGATTATLTITGANGADASSNYNCVVSNSCGVVTSTMATLAVGPCVTVTQAKQLADNSSVVLIAKSVTAGYSDRFYVEDANRSSGIQVRKTGYISAVDIASDVSGTIRTSTDGERYVDAALVVPGGASALKPVALTNRSIGGGPWLYSAVTGAGQKGITGASGLNNIGLYVATTGKVTYVGSNYYYVDDGTGINDGSGHLGIQVLALGLPLPVLNTYVRVTGISSCYTQGATLNRLIRAR